MEKELSHNGDECLLINTEFENKCRAIIPGIVDAVMKSCSNDVCFEHVDATIIPSKNSIVEIIHIMKDILYPGYFEDQTIDRNNLPYYIGSKVTNLFEKLSEQIAHSIMHDCHRYGQECSECVKRGQNDAISILQKIPMLREILATDVMAAYNGDPAAKSYDEIIFSYPGLFAITVYRIAHELYIHNIPILPRIMTEYAHSKVGIDIHPGATIGRSFFIDHGTGVVIGETCVIGNNVRIYQGVTLGALSISKDELGQVIRGSKRHPTIEDDVIIYSGATILGGETVIGARCVIGGNVWIIESVAPDTTVMLKAPSLIYKGHRIS